MDDRIRTCALKQHPERRHEFIVQSQMRHWLHPRGWAISGRNLMRESLYELWLNRQMLQVPSYLRYLSLRWTSRARQVDRPICLGYGAPNFWHFHNDVVYPLLLANQHGLIDGRAVIVPDSWCKMAFFHQALNHSSFLRSIDWVFQKPDQLLRVTRPIFISAAFAWPAAFARAAQEIVPPNVLSLQSEGSRRIYLTRQGATRAAANERELRALLSLYGFETVDTAALSVVEQAEAFRDAEMIVALHGAGLANLAHVVKPQVPFLEIIPENWINPCYLWMAVHKGMQYEGQVSSGSDASPDGRTTIDIQQVDDWLKRTAS